MPSLPVRSDHRFFGKAVLSMCIAYGLNWLYFDVDNTNLLVHAVRRHFASSIIYGLAHLPFIMVLTSLIWLMIGHYLGWRRIGISCNSKRLS